MAHPSAAGGGNGDNSPTFYYPGTTRVDIGDNGFHPRVARIKVNTSVLWVDRGSRPHTVRWDNGESAQFSSGPLRRGDTFLIRFPFPARVDYQSTARGDSGFHGVIDVG
jgi:plastocyanin